MNIRELIEIDSKCGCKGLYWKCVVNIFCVGESKMACNKTLKMLKRMSCKGCKDCDWLRYDFDQYFNEFLKGPSAFDKLEHGKIYTISPSVSQGYYDLYPEVEDLNFVEVEILKDEN